MQVAFLFAHRETDVWSTPLSLVREFERRGHEVKIYSLFNQKGEYTAHNITMLHLDYRTGDFIPDIVFYLDWGRFSNALLDKHFIPHAFFIAEQADEPQNFETNLKNAAYFHSVLTPDYPSFIKYTALGYDAAWFNHFADDTIHKSYTGIDSYAPVRSTRGAGGSELMDYISQVMPDKFINRNGLSGKEYGWFLNNGKITLQHSRWGEITRRIFEGMACGTMVITDSLNRIRNIDSLFKENEDIVYYDDVADCISKINYYLHNDKERERIAQNGFKKVHEYHTQRNRVDLVLSRYEQWKQKIQYQNNL